jgi:hypothetical protein
MPPPPPPKFQLLKELNKMLGQRIYVEESLPQVLQS